jgi:hypothetical protein
VATAKLLTRRNVERVVNGLNGVNGVICLLRGAAQERLGTKATHAAAVAKRDEIGVGERPRVHARTLYCYTHSLAQQLSTDVCVK